MDLRLGAFFRVGLFHGIDLILTEWLTELAQRGQASPAADPQMATQAKPRSEVQPASEARRARRILVHFIAFWMELGHVNLPPRLAIGQKTAFVAHITFGTVLSASGGAGNPAETMSSAMHLRHSRKRH